MQSEQKKLIENDLRDLILQADQVDEAVDQAKLFRSNCSREMGRKQVQQLSQMLKTLLCFITLDPVLLYLKPICCAIVISEVSRILQEALSLACECKCKTIFHRLFTGTKHTRFGKLFRRLNDCITDTSLLLIIYNPDFNSVVCNEIFLSLPQLILTNGSAIPSAWSCMVTKSTITSPLSCKMIKDIETLMLCSAKLVEEGHSELQYRLITIMEITAAAEYHIDLSCKAFKTNSPAAKATVELLLWVIKESEDYRLKVIAIKSVGSLARIFCEKKNHDVISVLVSQLENGHQEQEVVTEALTSLQKFACEDSNYLCKEHSNRMIELNAVQHLVKLLRDGERKQQLHGLVLMCHIGLNADYSEAMGQARVVTAIKQLLTEKRGPRRRTVVSRDPELKELATKALNQLNLYYKD